MEGRKTAVLSATVLDDEIAPKPEIIEYKTVRYPFGMFASAKTKLDALTDKLRDPFNTLTDKLREPIDKIQYAQQRKHHKLKEDDSKVVAPPKMS